MAVESKAMDHIHKILEQFGDKYFTKSGALKRNTVIEDLDNYDKDLMTAILKDDLLHKTYTSKIADVEIFEINKFVDMLRYKEYWEDSFTKYDNKIGLTAGGKYIDDSSDVVLDFPYKDCVLKAGMTKEDVEHSGDADEPFLNETLAKPEIDELFEPKIFINTTKYDENGETRTNSISYNDNLLINGNNLISMYSLLPTYAGKIKLIFMDPPYNTKGNKLPYNDRFNHSTWLTMMLNRLQVAKRLLSEDGMIFVSIDNTESHYLKVLMDSVFGRINFQNDIIWHYSGWNKKLNTSFENRHDDILFYTKSIDKAKFNSFFKPWKSEEEYVKKRKQKARYDENGEMFVLSDAGNGKRVKRYVKDAMKTGVVVDDVWDIDKINNSSKESYKFFGQKPEELIYRIISSATFENDIVLDCYLGTGTTAATALKTNRRFIGIEQMDYIDTIAISRLKAVIEGDQNGISKTVNWQGGGSFIYAKLMKKNQSYLRDLQNAKNMDELMNVYSSMKKNGDIDFRVDLNKFEASLKAGELPSLEDRKKELIKIIDKNQLYYNYSDIDDETVRDLVSNTDYEFNKSFYSSNNETGEE